MRRVYIEEAGGKSLQENLTELILCYNCMRDGENGKGGKESEMTKQTHLDKYSKTPIVGTDG